MENEGRNRIIDDLIELRKTVEHGTPEADTVFVPKELFWEFIDDYQRLVKAQHPRVMTLEEADKVLMNPLFIEHKPNASNVWDLPENYGKTWRCWTAKPTDNQMRKTPWET